MTESTPQNWHAAVALASIDAAGVGERVDIRIGRAADVLPTLVDGFDLVFIHADEESDTIYRDWAARLGHPGTVVVDNIGRSPLRHDGPADGGRQRAGRDRRGPRGLAGARGACTGMARLNRGPTSLHHHPPLPFEGALLWH